MLILEHSTTVVLPSIGIRMHCIFLTDRRDARALVNSTAPAPAAVLGPPAYDGRCDESGVVPSLLSALVVMLLCLTVLAL